MQLSNYEVAAVGDNGFVFVKITTDDGGQFGQWIRSGTQVEMDEQVQAAVARVAAAAAAQDALPQVGTVRTAADVQSSLAAAGSV